VETRALFLLLFMRPLGDLASLSGMRYFTHLQACSLNRKNLGLTASNSLSQVLVHAPDGS
jgi:hypothetical protein